MSFILRPWHPLLLVTSAAMQCWGEMALEVALDQLRMYKKRYGRIRLTDEERRVLAVKGKALDRRILEKVAVIVSPDTILRWHRQFIAAKWDYRARRKSPGRPKVANEIEELVLRMAKENPTWGYDRIQGALKNLGHAVSDTTVGNILKAHGIEPAPHRKRTTTWKTFIHAHCDVLAAVDFTTIEVRTPRGLLTFYLLFVMEIATRCVRFLGSTTNPDGVAQLRVGLVVAARLVGVGNRRLLGPISGGLC